MGTIILVDMENVQNMWSNALPPGETITVGLFFETEAVTPESRKKTQEECDLRKIPACFIPCKTGKNALDFQLSTELGFQVAMSPENKYIIISGDSGFDAVVYYWRRNGIDIVRSIPTGLALPNTPATMRPASGLTGADAIEVAFAGVPWMTEALMKKLGEVTRKAFKTKKPQARADELRYEIARVVGWGDRYKDLQPVIKKLLKQAPKTQRGTNTKGCKIRYNQMLLPCPISDKQRDTLVSLLMDAMQCDTREMRIERANEAMKKAFPNNLEKVMPHVEPVVNEIALYGPFPQ